MTFKQFNTFFDSLDGSKRAEFAMAYLDRVISIWKLKLPPDEELSEQAVEGFQTACNAIGYQVIGTPGEVAPFPTQRFLTLCKTGGFYCDACARFVDVTEGPDSIRRCDRCQGARLKWHPPIDGMNESK